MAGQDIKCPTCKRKIHYLSKEGLIITKNSIIESDPETGESNAICKFCKTRIFIGSLKLIAVA